MSAYIFGSTSTISTIKFRKVNSRVSVVDAKLAQDARAPSIPDDLQRLHVDHAGHRLDRAGYLR
jgi:hypothetical protein